MTTMIGGLMSRRAFLVAGGGAGAAVAAAAWWTAGTKPAAEYRLRAMAGRVKLVGAPHPDTDIWGYDGRVPGREVRLRQGERLRIVAENRLKEETTIHCHGLRIPNPMDGVPHLTQIPIAPGKSFVYEFVVPDAGTYWYHPHQRGHVQVGRGLYGPLIIDEPDPIKVDRDVTWMIDDWRLNREAKITDDFGDFRDMSHAGRIGNTVTINGRVPTNFEARAGERIRLRIINAANARNFALQFRGHAPRIIALDGQPVEPHEPKDGRVVLGPAMRADLILDMTGEPGRKYPLIDTFYKGRSYKILDIAYTGKAPVRTRPLTDSIRLRPNTMPEPKIEDAERHRIVFGGGMMGGMTGARLGGRQLDIRELMHKGKMWAINGVVATGHVMAPLLTLRRGRSYILEMKNDSAFHHPIHLHGHSFRVIARDGKPTRHREWRDTVLMAPRERVDIAFVADNPGDWMFHCHILEHMVGGMMGVIRVA